MQLKVAGSGMRIVGIPVETEMFQRQSVAEAMRGDPAERLRTLVPMGDAHATFQNMCLSAVTRTTFFCAPSPRASHVTLLRSLTPYWSGHQPQSTRGKARPPRGQPAWTRSGSTTVSANSRPCTGRTQSDAFHQAHLLSGKADLP